MTEPKTAEEFFKSGEEKLRKIIDGSMDEYSEYKDGAL